MLIYAQRPTAMHVRDYCSWLKAGYQVRKGEKGIAIYAPMRFGARSSDDEFNECTNAAPRLGFRVAYVFDISQVDAPPGEPPQFASTVGASRRCPGTSILEGRRRIGSRAFRA